jgi:phage host-nuclease inhibitor protein Gam
MTRISKKTIVGVTLSEAQEAANIYAERSIEKDKLVAQMNEKLTAIRTKYEPDITGIDTELEEPVLTLETYAKEQRKNWDGKSIELANCVIGFRTNPPSVTKKKGITWDAVVGLFKNNKLLKSFVKVKEDIDKSAILKSQTDVKIVKMLNSVGVTIEQEEQFFVNTKKEEAATA